MRSTFDVIESGEPHRVAAAFALGREDIVPGMFKALLAEMKITEADAPTFHYSSPATRISTRNRMGQWPSGCCSACATAMLGARRKHWPRQQRRSRRASTFGKA